MSDEIINSDDGTVIDGVPKTERSETSDNTKDTPPALKTQETSVEPAAETQTKEPAIIITEEAQTVAIEEPTPTDPQPTESNAPTAEAASIADTTLPSQPSAENSTQSGGTQSEEEKAPTTQAANENAESVDGDSAAVTMDSEYAEHVKYNEDGCAIYTDPSTKYQYKWSTAANNWLPITDTNTPSTTDANSDPYENEHYRWCTKTQQWLPKAQTTETEHYKWDAVKNEWIPKTVDNVEATPATTTATDVVYGLDEDGQRIYTDKDGAVFFWDTAKKAWFPKIDDDFMARYQMNYGFIDNTSAGEEEQRLKAEAEAKRKADELERMTAEAIKATNATEQPTSGAQNAGIGKRKAPAEPPKWFDLDPEQNTKVYVTNLPLDITLDEFAELMGKCGMIMRDPQTQKYKLKLYAEANGQLKGDGLCDYIKVESVGLALKILDEYNFRGHKIHVQRAKFQMRGEYNPALKPKRKKKDKEKLQKIKEKLFDWRPEKMRGERSKNEKIVIIKNLFHPDIFEKEVQLILDYQNDLREECSKCGTVRKVVIYDRHSEGVAQINMSSPEEADVVIQMMHGRFFGKRQLSAEHWDGKTKYKVVESEQEVEKRLTNWDKFLTEDETAEQKAQSAQLRAQAEQAAQTTKLENEMHAEDVD